MSETGATDEQIEAIAEWTWGREASTPWGEALPSLQSLYRTTVADDVRRILPPGYQIVPAGAVVLSAEEAELGADGLSRLIARYESLANEHDRSGRTEQWLWERNNAAKFSALAAKLSGGAS